MVKQKKKKIPKVEITTHKIKNISPEERQQIIDELRLVPKKYKLRYISLEERQQIIDELSLV